MNHLLALLTAAACGLAVSGAAEAMPAGADLRVPEQAGLILRVQAVGGGGPASAGPTGRPNGIGAGGVLGGTGAGHRGGAPGSGAALRPRGANQKPNGSKPAPMRPNGVRDVR